jgi:hypothetical protein
MSRYDGMDEHGMDWLYGCHLVGFVNHYISFIQLNHCLNQFIIDSIHQHHHHWDPLDKSATSIVISKISLNESAMTAWLMNHKLLLMTSQILASTSAITKTKAFAPVAISLDLSWTQMDSIHGVLVMISNPPWWHFPMVVLCWQMGRFEAINKILKIYLPTVIN